MSPHLLPVFSSSRCILGSVISNRLKVTAAAVLHSRLSHSLWAKGDFPELWRHHSHYSPDKPRQSCAKTCFTAVALSFHLLPLCTVSEPRTNTVRHSLSHISRTALSYSVAVKEGAEPIAVEAGSRYTALN